MRTKINQSKIDWIEWNENNTMLVAFDNGKIAMYEDVPAGIERGLIQAPSPGSYFNRYIKGVFQYTIVTNEVPPTTNLQALQHEYDSTRGLWCIDRDPKEVDIEWIRRNAFQLTDYIGESECGKQRVHTVVQ